MSCSSLKWSRLLAIIVIYFLGTCMSLLANTPQIKSSSLEKELADLEFLVGGRIGLSALNTANNQRLQYRAMNDFLFVVRQNLWQCQLF